MKNLEELLKKAAESDELKDALQKAVKSGKVQDFLSEHGIDASEDEVKKILKDKLPDIEKVAAAELEKEGKELLGKLFK